MREKLGKWVMAALLVCGCLPLTAGAETVLEGRTASPFVASYSAGTHRAGDFGELYHLSGGVAAYRLTPDGGKPSGDYSRENLEYHTHKSQQIRAVLQGGYPMESLEELTRKANRALEGSGITPITHLQEGEAILATQLALWDVSVEEYVSDWKNLAGASWRDYPGSIALAGQTMTEYSAGNVEALCRYLKQLPPCAPRKVTVCDGALEREGYHAEETGGAYRIIARVRIRADIGDGDALTLTATCAGQSQQLAVTEPGSYEVVFDRVEGKVPVAVTVSGTQSGGDAYVFQSGREYLAGWDESPRQVTGRLLLEPDRILRLSQSSQGQGLGGMEYSVYLAATREELENGTVSLESIPTAAEIARIQTPEALVAILRTDESGLAQYNFTAHGDPEGIYLVVENTTAGAPAEPFYVAMLGDGYERRVALQARMEAAMELTMNIDQIGTTQLSAAVGQRLSWIARSTLPTGLAGAGGFRIRIEAAEGLSLDKNSVTVSLYDGASEIPLAEQVHYILEGEGLALSLTPAGIAYGAAQQNGEMPELRIRFQGMLTSTAALGTPLACRGRGEYLNAAGIRFSVTGEEATVCIGGLAIQKTEPGGTPVAGAAFSLARPAQPGEAGAQTLMVGQEEQQVVYVTFLPTRDGTGETTAVTRTDKNGRAWLTGIAYGLYYLVEEGQPAVAVTVDALSHMDGTDGMPDHTLILVQERSLLPHTGDLGIQILTAIGSAALLIACALTLAGRKQGYRNCGV